MLPLMMGQQRQLYRVAADDESLAARLVLPLMRREKIKKKIKRSLPATCMSPLMGVKQWQLYGVAVDNGSLAATILSPLMRKDKIKIKNKRLISGNNKVAAN